MKKILFCFVIGCAGLIGLNACDGNAGNTNSNMNSNSNRSAISSAINSTEKAVNTAANTLSNAVSSVTTSKPTDFMTEAAQGGLTEVELGKIAAKKAQNPEVKKFGQMMVDDHTKINNDLKAVAAKSKFTLPTDPGSHKSTIDKMNGLNGADFDKEYVNDMVDDHEKDVSAFEKQATNSTDPDVKAFAEKSLPVIKRHLEAIKAIKAKMK